MQLHAINKTYDNLNNLLDHLAPITPQIERESFKIILSKVNIDTLRPAQAYLVLRAIHASANLELVNDIVFSNNFESFDLDNLKEGLPLITDSFMAKSAINYKNTKCLVRLYKATDALTRSQKAILGASRRYPKNSMFLIGSAPTALQSLLDEWEATKCNPLLVVATPVGFVGATESKARLKSSDGLTYVTNSSNLGGAAIAASTFNALVRLAKIGS